MLVDEFFVIFLSIHHKEMNTTTQAIKVHSSTLTEEVLKYYDA